MRILVVEQDPVFAALLEDRLTVAGHAVEVVADGIAAVRQAGEQAVDLMILELELPKSSGMEVLRALRCQPETQALPVLILAGDDDSGRRLAALKAGADDYVARPCDLEEITLRVDRLLGVRGRDTVALQGDLERHPVWEVIQYIVSSQRSGFLLVRNGRLQVVGGRAVAARYRELAGREALLAIASAKEGRFRFVEGVGDDPADAEAAASLPVSQILMEAAWLTDELARREAFIPPTGAPLQLAGPAPKVAEELAGLPVGEVLRRVGAGERVRLYDLLAENAFAAPLKVRLAVAWLAEKGALEVAGGKARVQYPSTTELSASVLLQVAVEELLGKARKAGHGSSVVPYFILATSGVWPRLAELVTAAPRSSRQGSLPDKLRSGSSTVFEADAGRLSLHLQELASPVPRQIETVISVCAGVVLWVDGAEILSEIRGLIEQVEERRLRQSGLIIAAGAEAHGAARLLAREGGAWRILNEAPRSLLGLLRLLGNP